MSDTPETDAFFMREDIDWDMEYDLCRKLERERDVAREVTKNLSVALTAAIRSANARQDETEHAMAERDEAIRACEIWQHGVSKIVEDRDHWRAEAERWRDCQKDD